MHHSLLLHNYYFDRNIVNRCSYHNHALGFTNCCNRSFGRIIDFHHMLNFSCILHFGRSFGYRSFNRNSDSFGRRALIVERGLNCYILSYIVHWFVVAALDLDLLGSQLRQQGLAAALRPLQEAVGLSKLAILLVACCRQRLLRLQFASNGRLRKGSRAFLLR
jgi:hypothetical protein